MCAVEARPLKLCMIVFSVKHYPFILGLRNPFSRWKCASNSMLMTVSAYTLGIQKFEMKWVRTFQETWFLLSYYDSFSRSRNVKVQRSCNVLLFWVWVSRASAVIVFSHFCVKSDPHSDILQSKTQKSLACLGIQRCNVVPIFNNSVMRFSTTVWCSFQHQCDVVPVLATVLMRGSGKQNQFWVFWSRFSAKRKRKY